MDVPPTATPPTSPTDSGAPGGLSESEARLLRLERRLKWMLVALACCGVLVVGLAVLSVAVVRDYAMHLARQRTEQAAQMQLLQQLQQDFDTFEVRAPGSQVEAYGQLREQLNQLRGIYGGIEEYDLTDPLGSLDALMGIKKTNRPSEPPPDPGDASPPPGDG